MPDKDTHPILMDHDELGGRFGVVMQQTDTQYLRRLCDACGMYDGARAESPECVFERCIDRARSMRNALTTHGLGALNAQGGRADGQ